MDQKSEGGKVVIKKKGRKLEKRMRGHKERKGHYPQIGIIEKKVVHVRH